MSDLAELLYEDEIFDPVLTLQLLDEIGLLEEFTDEDYFPLPEVEYA